MRLNQFLAKYTTLSRRGADAAIKAGRVTIDGQTAKLGQPIEETDNIALDSSAITPDVKTTTIMLNKPAGYVCSRKGQGSKTIYDLLPPELHNLNPVGRLDKDSSGLLLLTNDGNLANELTHPRYEKSKVYEVELDKPLQLGDKNLIVTSGVNLEDGPSKFEIKDVNGNKLTAILQEGRNRQIRRTFEGLDYEVTKLHRTHFGPYDMSDLPTGKYKLV